MHGAAGEAIAGAFLEARGYRIHARNVRRNRREIDLVAQRGDVWVAVEVKWRRADGDGWRAHTAWSAAQRSRAAHALAALRQELDPGQDRHWRLDLVVIEERPRGLVLTHHAGAWSPGESYW